MSTMWPISPDINLSLLHVAFGENVAGDFNDSDMHYEILGGAL